MPEPFAENKTERVKIFSNNMPLICQAVSLFKTELIETYRTYLQNVLVKQLVVTKYTTSLLKVMFADLKILENCRWNSIWKNDSLRQFQLSIDKNLR